MNFVRIIIQVLLICLIGVLISLAVVQSFDRAFAQTAEEHNPHYASPLPDQYRYLSTTFSQGEKARGHWDMPCPSGTEVKAPCDGDVVCVGWLPDIGNHIYIVDKEGREHRLGHFRARNWLVVLPGQKVKTGDLIGYSGGADKARGHSSGGHIHWQIIDNRGRLVNPRTLLGGSWSI